MANEGLYIKQGGSWQLKNNNTAYNLTKGESYIYAKINGGWTQIYPRSKEVEIPPSANGGIYLATCNSRYTSWNSDKALQGYYTGVDGNPGERIGHIFWRSGKPSLPGLISVNRVRFTILRNVNTGWYHQAITGRLCMSSYTGASGGIDGCRSYANSHAKFSFTWGVGGTTTVIDNNGELNNFMYQFLTTGDAHSLCLYNGENSATKPYNGHNMSANYGGTRNVTIEIWASCNS